MRKITLIILLAFLGLSYNLNAQTDVVINEDSIKEAKLLALPKVKDFARRVGDTLVLKLDNGAIEKYVNYKGKMPRKGSIYFEKNGEGFITKNDLASNVNGSEAIVTESIALGYINYTLVGVAGNGKLMIVKNMREYDPMFVSLSGQLPDCDDHVMLISVVNGENTVILEGGFDYVERNTKGYNSHISPDNKRCVIINNNFCKFEKSAFISIIQTDSSFVEEFKFEFDELKYYISDFQWLSNDEILIKRENPVNANPLTPLKFKWNGTKWVLATAQPAKKPAPAVKKPIKK